MPTEQKDAELVSHLRHDLIKHLDIPKAHSRMTRSGWDVLLRRLYAGETGVVALGAQWTRRLEDAWGGRPLLDAAVKDLSHAVAQLNAIREDNERRAREVSPAGAELVEMLNLLVARVRSIETVTEGVEEVDALDWLLGDNLPAPEAHEFAAVTESPLRPEGGRYRVLVVDDRLQSIERFHSLEHLRDRFEWVTLCELDGPCWTCEHQSECPMKRARTFREFEGALRRAQSRGTPIDVILMDVRFDDIAAGELLPTPPGFEPDTESTARGLQGPLMVRELNERNDLPQPPVVLMTGRDTLPPGAERLLEGLDGLHFVDDEASIEALTARLDIVARRGSRPISEGAFFWGRSPVMLSVREQIELLAMGPRPVLLTGPSGSGKSFLVEEVLLPVSKRTHLVTMDLSAMPETLVESELFGHVRGAFSGAVAERKGLAEEADGGILFIDEIGHLSAENQRKLLLFLQDKQVRRVGASHHTRHAVDVKVVVATHLDLQEEVEAGRFRFDLFMRLRPATQVRLPSLAERPEDLDGMMSHIVRRLVDGPELRPYVLDVSRARRMEPKVELIIGSQRSTSKGLSVRLPTATAVALKNHSWPGNTRELESVLDTLLLRAFADSRRVEARSHIIEVDHYLTLKLLGVGRHKSTAGQPMLNLAVEPSGDLKRMRNRLERAYLIEAFRAADGDMERMTEMVLGSPTVDDRHRLTVRMNQLGLKVTELKHTTP